MAGSITAEKHREWRKKNPEKWKATLERYRNSHREELRQRSRDYRLAHKGDEERRRRANINSLKRYYRNKEKARARNAVRKAVQAGRLIRPNECQKCYEVKPLHGHHEDYNKRLDVIWLCMQCHERLHHGY